jgi:hypothetical protein
MRYPTVIVCLALSVCSFGFVHKPKMAKPNVPEVTQDILRHEQSFQGVHAPVGKEKPKERVQIPLPVTDSRAAGIISGSSSLVHEGKLTTSHPDAHESGTSSKGPIGAAALGLGAFFAFWVAGRRQQA